MGQMMFTKYLVVGMTTWTCTTPAKSSSASAPTPIRNATAFSPKGRSDVLYHATSKMAMGSKLGFDLQSQPRCTFTKRDLPGINAASI